MLTGLQERVPLDRYSTLHVGGAARYFARVASLEQLRAALSWAAERQLPWFILGGGANFFCRDAGFAGLVIKMENRSVEIPNCRFPMANGARAEVTTEAGALTRMLVLKTVERGLRGIERLAGIPGTVGGAVRGNAGSFGTETKDFLSRVRVLRRTAQGWNEDVLPREQLFFAYRDSTFKRHPQDSVVWSATFALEPGDRAEGERLVAQDLAERKAKQPYEYPSVGSIFQNPSSLDFARGEPLDSARGEPLDSARGEPLDFARGEPLDFARGEPLDFARGEPAQTAGQLIETAGLKGLRVGGAEVSRKHANFIVNRGGAKASDVLALIRQVKKNVQQTCGVTLEEEIVVL